nr:hypothetical protein [Hepelivirales sp.]WAY16433.1 hypothetical protein [Hepelivirales sp.]
MDNFRIKIITVKERLNNYCQINHFRSPIHSFVWHFKQRIPSVIIGSITYYAENWACDDNQKVIELVEAILLKLNDSTYVKANSDALSGNFFPFPEVFDLSADRKITICKHDKCIHE